MGGLRLLYSEICIWLRRNMHVSGTSTENLRAAERRVLGVIMIDDGMGCSQEARTRSAWAFARRYVEEALPNG